MVVTLDRFFFFCFLFFVVLRVFSSVSKTFPLLPWKQQLAGFLLQWLLLEFLNMKCCRVKAKLFSIFTFFKQASTLSYSNYPFSTFLPLTPHLPHFYYLLLHLKTNKLSILIILIFIAYIHLSNILFVFSFPDIPYPLVFLSQTFSLKCFHSVLE